MLRVLTEHIRKQRLIKPEETIVVAVSGGADSIALLHLLATLRTDPDWRIRIVAAHLNHMTRGMDSGADAVFVEESARRIGIECLIDQRDVPGLAVQHGTGTEETGRRERYAFFERTCIKTSAHVVAVAHHADDQAETVFHRIARGTGLRGLAGMPASRPLSTGSAIRLIRPLLGFTRADLREYLASHQIPFRADASNESLEPIRNRIRNLVFPLVEQQINPQVRGALIRLAEQARWFEEYFHENVQRTFDTLLVSRTDQSVILNSDALARKSKLLQTGLIREAYVALGRGEADLAFANLVAVADLLDDPVSGKIIQLPGGVVVEKRYQQLIFCSEVDAPGESRADQVVVRVPGRTLLTSRSLEICCEVSSPPTAQITELRDRGSRLNEHLDLDAIHAPLLVRSRRPGERFWPLGAPGSKKLSDYLTDSKVPPGERRKIVVVCDQLGPIWVVGHRIDDRVKLTSRTRRVLHLEARELGC